MTSDPKERKHYASHGHVPEEPVPTTGEGPEGVPPAEGRPAPVADEVEELRRRAEEADSCRDQLLRLMAEFDNYRKRRDRESAELKDRALEEFLGELLPVTDDLQRALAAGKEGATLESFLDGITLVNRALAALLERTGVLRIPSAGEPFDPNLHEAVVREEGEGETDTVLEEYRPGYTYRGRLLRAAMVRVAVGKGSSSGQS